MNTLQRAAVIAEAESWLRTPYHSNAAVKGAGADCALMPLAVYTKALGLKAPPLPKYVAQWALTRGEEKYLTYVRELGAKEITQDQLLPGDFVLWRLGRIYCHGAIVIAWPKVLHAINPRGVTYGDAARDEMYSRTAVTQPLFFTF
jgi:cell wall-associated NlpC family hydrolase